MNYALISTAAAIGLAGGVHCIAMCASPAALAVPASATLPFQVGRVIGYAILGAIAALGAASFAQVATSAAWVRPFWLMTHVAMMLLGGWMLVTGRHPAWLQQALLDLARGLMGRLTRFWGVAAAPLAAAVPGTNAGTASAYFHDPILEGSPHAAGEPPSRGVEIRLPARIRRRPPQWRITARGIVTGMVWALLPCGLLYSAVMLAWMSGEVATGATAMAVFAIVSGAQLWLGQRGLLALLNAGHEALAIRIAGAITLAGAGLLLAWVASGHAPEGFCLPGF